MLKHPNDTSHIENVWSRVALWNQLRNNLDQNPVNGFKMIAEELFELAAYKRQAAKDLANDLTDNYFISGYRSRVEGFDAFGFTDSDMADALGDIIFIAIGELVKFGYNPETVLNKICDANDKKGSKKNSDGKIVKDETFVEPEHTKVA